MRRWSLVLCALITLRSSPMEGQASLESLREGTTIRVWSKKIGYRKREGQSKARHGDTLDVSFPRNRIIGGRIWRSTLSIRLADIDSVEVRVHRYGNGGGVGRGVRVGCLVGAAFGGAVGVLVSRAEGEGSGSETGAFAALGAIVGCPSGALYGALGGLLSPQWVVVQLPRQAEAPE